MRRRGSEFILCLLCSLRSLLVVVNCSSRDPDPKLLHLDLERRTLHSQTSRRSVRSRNHSIRLFQSTQNLTALRLLQHVLKALMGRGFGSGGDGS